MPVSIGGGPVATEDVVADTGKEPVDEATETFPEDVVDDDKVVDDDNTDEVVDDDDTDDEEGVTISCRLCAIC